MHKDLFRNIFLLTCLSMYTVIAYSNENIADIDKYTLNKFITESLNEYSGLTIATLNVNKLAYEIEKVSSRLGWIVTSQGGYSRDSSSFGIETDTVDFGVGLEKPLESGNTFSISAKYRHSDSEQVLSTLSPNPSDTTNLDLSYRVPLLDGSGNPQYKFDADKANIESKISILEKEQIKESLILQLIDIYYLIATIDSRLETAKKSLRRTRALRKYINNNINLGLLEKGDILQIDSQIFALELEEKRILDIREKQVVAINRFLNKHFSSDFVIAESDLYGDYKLNNVETIISNIKSHDYEVKKLKFRSKLLDSSLALSRSREKNKLDLVLSIGVQNRSGNNAGNSIDDTDTTGMMRFEYRNALDKKLFSSQRLQLQLDREVVIEQMSSINKDLEYDAFNQFNQVEKSQEIVSLAVKKLKNETLKHKDILKRFKNGRSTTNIVIQFDNERIRSELEYETERYELAKRIDLLLLKQGLLLNK